MKRAALLALLGLFLLSFAVSSQSRPAPTAKVSTCPCGSRCTCPPDKCPNKCDRDCCPGGSCYVSGPHAPLTDYGRIALGGQVSPDGKVVVDIDLPVDVRMRNIGSHVDGAGMCVSTSITHAARWHNMRDWWTWRDWCAKYPGGGYPSKMDKQVKQFAQEKGIPVPPYLQYEGSDPTIIKEALKAGLLVSGTYNGRDGVRYNGSIAHMVNYVVWTDEWVAIMDNNGKAEELIWMSPAEALERWAGRGGGWVFIWLVAPPPPCPCN